MLYATAYQAFEIPVMLAAGIVMGLTAMLFRILRRLLCAGRLTSLICDIVMGVCWAAEFCAALTVVNRGRLRLHHLLLSAAGAAAVHAALSVSPGKKLLSLKDRSSEALKKAKSTAFLRFLLK